MRKFTLLFVVLFAAAATSCVVDHDDDPIPDVLEGRTWTGSVGLRADNGEPLFSSFYFGTDGFGTEKQYYTSDGVYYADFRFLWYWEQGHKNNLVLDYGKYGISYMDDIYIRFRAMSGVFYLREDGPGFPFRLYMD